MARLAECRCGSGEWPDAHHDGHGIFLTYACGKCWPEKRKQYRADIMDRYECDEPIEAEEY